MTDILRYAAFPDGPGGGNPAGVVLDARGLSDERMLAIAAEVGYSETAFLVAHDGERGAYDVRYFSPETEVPFCGHATIAASVAIAEREGGGDLALHTPAGVVPVRTTAGTATLTSVAPRIEELSVEDVEQALALLGWSSEDLDPGLPPRMAFAGARHLVLGAATRERLSDLDYNFAGLRAFMQVRDLITVHLVWREDDQVFHARDPFPVGGVVEDPATGAAAAAFGAYLRELGLVTPPARITILQGYDMGRPSRLLVDIDAARPEISVTGGAAPI